MAEVVDGFDGLDKWVANLQQTYMDGIPEDANRLLLETREGLQEDHAEFFREARDARGTPWEELKQVTIKKKGHSAILIETRALDRSLTEAGTKGAIRMIRDEQNQTALYFGTSVSYAWRHQEGQLPRMPARPPVGLTDDRIDDFSKRVADLAVARLRGDQR